MKFSDLRSGMLCLRPTKKDWAAYYYVMDRHEDTIDYATLMRMDNLWILRIRYNETEEELIRKSVQLLNFQCQEYNRDYRRDILRVMFSYRVDVYIGEKNG